MYKFLHFGVTSHPKYRNPDTSVQRYEKQNLLGVPGADIAQWFSAGLGRRGCSSPSRG